MPPPKKAAKKAPKKAAKKAPKKSPRHPHEAHHHTKDLRRSYEHLGRIEVLRATLGSVQADSVDSVDTLAKLAQQELQAQNYKSAADLLRSAEHVSFATLVSIPGRENLSPDLKSAVDDHFVELSNRADDHWQNKDEHRGAIATLYKHFRESANRAYKAGQFHSSLEYIRAAEALTHVEELSQPRLEEVRNNSPLLDN